MFRSIFPYLNIRSNALPALTACILTLTGATACSETGDKPDGAGGGSATGGASGSGGTAPVESDCPQCSGEWSALNREPLCKSSLRVAVFGDSNWAHGSVAMKLQQLDPTSTYVNIAQEGSGKSIPGMMDLNVPGKLTSEGPFDVVLLAIGTNDGRCGPDAPCNSAPLPDGVTGEKPSWCAAAPASVEGVKQNAANFLDQIEQAHPAVLKIMVGPPPTFNPAPGNAASWCEACGCGYSILSQGFMGQLSQAFAELADMRGLPYVDIFNPFLETASPTDAKISTVMSDGVHYGFGEAGVTVAAEEVHKLITTLKSCE